MNAPVPTYRLYGEDKHEAADFWLHFEELPVRSRPYRWEIGRHRHGGFFQIFTILAGGGELLGEAAPQHFQAPCLIFIPAGAVHGFRFEHESDGTVLTVRGDRLEEAARADRRFAPFFLERRIQALDGDDEHIGGLRSALERVRQELSGNEAGRMTLISSLLTEILIYLARASAPGLSDPNWTEGRDTARMQSLDELIETHLREHRPIAFYAGRLGLSPTHLNRLCRLRFGESVQALIDRKLVAAAKRELVFSRFPVQTVAFSLGFSDPAYFNRYFRKKTGMTPGRYRAAQRERSIG
ncbi:MAG: helix-turn-helix domain-containing protein [Rhizobiaceae bacterium]